VHANPPVELTAGATPAPPRARVAHAPAPQLGETSLTAPAPSRRQTRPRVTRPTAAHHAEIEGQQ
jgi:hypothetical protein